jgi:NADP-dependent 3-hydroxy acid dehydrogenase YdfG
MAIKDKVVIITGASSGIGEAAAKLLASKGAKLTLGARREDKLKAITEEIVRNGGEAAYAFCDVTNPVDNFNLVEFTKSKYGRVDAIFLNAGIMPQSPLSKLMTQDWRNIVDTNLQGVLNGIGAVLPEFVSQKSGHIIAVSSVAGLKIYPGGAVYCATKWAVRALMETLRMESASEGTNIRTTTIYPAAIKTELLNTITDKETLEAYNKLYDTYAIGPESVANIVSFAIDQPENTNVSEFTVGPTAQPW